eukprot:scaffold25380_cov36-Tisochrysis_lutea.AAC.2
MQELAEEAGRLMEKGYMLTCAGGGARHDVRNVRLLAATAAVPWPWLNWQWHAPSPIQWQQWPCLGNAPRTLQQQQRQWQRQWYTGARHQGGVCNARSLSPISFQPLQSGWVLLCLQAWCASVCKYIIACPVRQQAERVHVLAVED